jgi:hypothetical protein
VRHGNSSKPSSKAVLQTCAYAQLTPQMLTYAQAAQATQDSQLLQHIQCIIRRPMLHRQ